MSSVALLRSMIAHRQSHCFWLSVYQSTDDGRPLTDTQVLRITTRAHSGEVSGPIELPLEEEALLKGKLRVVIILKNVRASV